MLFRSWIYTGQTAGVGEDPKKDISPQINQEANRNIEVPSGIPDINVPDEANKESVLGKLPAQSPNPNLLNVVRKPQGPTNRKVPSRGHVVAIRDKYADAKPIQEEECSREITFDMPVEEEKKVEPAPVRYSPMKPGAFGIGNIDAGALRAGLRKVN